MRRLRSVCPLPGRAASAPPSGAGPPPLPAPPRRCSTRRAELDSHGCLYALRKLLKPRSPVRRLYRPQESSIRAVPARRLVRPRVRTARAQLRLGTTARAPAVPARRLVRPRVRTARAQLLPQRAAYGLATRGVLRRTTRRWPRKAYAAGPRLSCQSTCRWTPSAPLWDTSLASAVGAGVRRSPPFTRAVRRVATLSPPCQPGSRLDRPRRRTLGPAPPRHRDRTAPARSGRRAPRSCSGQCACRASCGRRDVRFLATSSRRCLRRRRACARIPVIRCLARRARGRCRRCRARRVDVPRGHTVALRMRGRIASSPRSRTWPWGVPRSRRLALAPGRRCLRHRLPCGIACTRGSPRSCATRVR